ncbi:site-specific integrase, partial [Enterococcus faecalis]
ELAPGLKVKHLDRKRYLQLLNDKALTHERLTTMDFHHQLKGAFLDAVDVGLNSKKPKRKIVIKGKAPSPKKTKFLN